MASEVAADPNIKKIQILPTGPAASENMAPMEGGDDKKAQQRRTRKRKTLRVGGEEGAPVAVAKEGGGGTSPGTLTQLAATHVPGAATATAAAKAVGVNSSLTQKGAPVSGGAATAAAAAAQPSNVKVILAAPKKQKNKVVLAPATASAATSPPPSSATAADAVAGGSLPRHGHGKTRKINRARKIKVSMKTLRRKLHKARTIRKSAEEHSMEQIKKELQKAGILKAESKAPEPILRQMYADYLTLKNRAL